MPSKPLNTILLKNRSGHPMTMKRAKSGAEYIIREFSGVGLKVYKAEGFLAIDWETRTVWTDLGDEDD